MTELIRLAKGFGICSHCISVEPTQNCEQTTEQRPSSLAPSFCSHRNCHQRCEVTCLKQAEHTSHAAATVPSPCMCQSLRQVCGSYDCAPNPAQLWEPRVSVARQSAHPHPGSCEDRTPILVCGSRAYGLFSHRRCSRCQGPLPSRTPSACFTDRTSFLLRAPPTSKSRKKRSSKQNQVCEAMGVPARSSAPQPSP